MRAWHFPSSRKKTVAEAHCAWVLIYKNISAGLRWLSGARWFLRWFSFAWEGTIRLYPLLGNGVAVFLPVGAILSVWRWLVGPTRLSFISVWGCYYSETWKKMPFRHILAYEERVMCKGWLSLELFLQKRRQIWNLVQLTGCGLLVN